MNKFLIKNKKIFCDASYKLMAVLMVIFSVFLAVESVIPSLIIAAFNFNIIILGIFFLLLLTIKFHCSKSIQAKAWWQLSWLFLFFLAILVTLIVWFKLNVILILIFLITLLIVSWVLYTSF